MSERTRRSLTVRRHRRWASAAATCRRWVRRRPSSQEALRPRLTTCARQASAVALRRSAAATERRQAPATANSLETTTRDPVWARRRQEIRSLAARGRCTEPCRSLGPEPRGARPGMSVGPQRLDPSKSERSGAPEEAADMAHEAAQPRKFPAAQPQAEPHRTWASLRKPH